MRQQTRGEGGGGNVHVGTEYSLVERLKRDYIFLNLKSAKIQGSIRY